MLFNGKFKKVRSSLVFSSIGLGCTLSNVGGAASAEGEMLGKLAYFFFFLKTLIFGAKNDNTAESQDNETEKNKISESSKRKTYADDAVERFKNSAAARIFMKNLKAISVSQSNMSFDGKEELGRLFTFLSENGKDLGLQKAKFDMSKRELMEVVRKKDYDELKKVLGDVGEDINLDIKGVYFSKGSGSFVFKVREKNSKKQWFSLKTFRTEDFKSVKNCVEFINGVFEKLRERNKWSGKLELLVEKDGVYLVRYDKKGCIVKKASLKNLEKSSFLDEAFTIRYNVDKDAGAFENLFFRSSDLAYHYNNMRNVFANFYGNSGVLEIRDTVFRMKKRELKNILRNKYVKYVQEDGIDLSEENDDVDVKLEGVFDNGFMTLKVKEVYSSEWSEHTFVTKYATCDVDKIVNFFNYVFENSRTQKNLPYVYKLRVAEDKGNVYLAKYDVKTGKKVGEIEIGGDVVDVSDNAGYKVSELASMAIGVA